MSRSASTAPAPLPVVGPERPRDPTPAPIGPGARGARTGVLVLDGRGAVIAADAAAATLVAPGMPALRHGLDLPSVLRAAGEGTAALAVANALAARDEGEVVFTVHDAAGLARARWRLMPIPRPPASGGAAWTVVVEREPDGAPGRREAETLAAVARELARVGDDGSAALAELARGALALFEAAGACVVTFDDAVRPGDRRARVAATAGTLDSLAGHVTVLMREPSLFGDVARTHDVVVVNDAEHDPRIDPRYGGPFGMRQVLAAPLIIDGHVAAQLCVVNVPRGAFAAPDVELARRLADHGALALRNVRLLAARALAQARAEVAAAVAQVALDAADVPSGAEQILAQLYRVVPSPGKLLSVHDRERGVLRCVAATGDVTHIAGTERPLAETIQNEALARGELVEVTDLRATLREAGRGAEPAPAGGVILVPIMAHGAPIGDLCVRHAPDAPLGAAALETLRLLGPSVGVAMDMLLHEERERARADEERRRDEQLRQAEKLAALGELVAGVAHEMNNPLAGISAFAELLLSEPDDATFDTENREAVRHIKREADRATAVVRDLLTFAREAAPAWGPVALDAVLERTVRVRAYAARTAGLDLRLDVEPGLPPVRGDERKLQQVFINLVANAEHAAGKAPPGARRVVVRAWRAGPDRVAVRVSDTGRGVPPDILGRVFEPFFTTKPPGEGTGLGLSVSYGIVQAHRGELRAQNLPGGGAAFDVLLPVDSGAHETR
ncbi:MAG TPA: ATP-binding protein [Gemmatirosa sp.]